MIVKKSMQNRLLYPVLGLIILGIIITACVAYFEGSDTVLNADKRSLKQTIEIVTHGTNEWVIDCSEQVKQWASAPIVVTSLVDTENTKATPQGEKYLARILKNQRYFTSLQVGKPDGYILYSTTKDQKAEASQDQKEVNVGGNEYYKKALTGKVALSPPTKDPKTGQPFLTIAAPITNSNDETVGVMLGKVDMHTYFAENVSNIELPEGCYIFVSNKNGIAFVHPNTFSRSMSKRCLSARILLARNKRKSITTSKGSVRLAIFPQPTRAGKWPLPPTRLFSSPVSIRCVIGSPVSARSSSC